MGYGYTDGGMSDEKSACNSNKNTGLAQCAGFWRGWVGRRVGVMVDGYEGVYIAGLLFGIW